MMGGQGVGGGVIGGSSKNALLRNQLNNPTGSFGANPMSQVSQQQQQQITPLNLQRNHQQPIPSPTNMMSGGGIVGALGSMRMSPNFPYSSNSLILNNTPLPSRVTNSLTTSAQSRYSPSLGAARISSMKASIAQAEKVATSTHQTSNKIIQRRKSKVAEKLGTIQLPRLSPFLKANILESLTSTSSTRLAHISKTNVLDTPATSQSTRVVQVSKANVLDTPATSQSTRVALVSKANVLDAQPSTQSTRVSHSLKSNERPNTSANLSILPDKVAPQQTLQTSKSNVRPNLSVLPDKVAAIQQTIQTPRPNQLSKINVRPNSSANLSILPDKGAGIQQTIQTPRTSQLSISNVRSMSTAIQQLMNPKFTLENTSSTIKSTKSVLQTTPLKPLATTSNGKPMRGPVLLKEVPAPKGSPLISIKSPSSINKDASSVIHKPLNKTPMNPPLVAVAGNIQTSNVSKSSPIMISNVIGGLNQRQIVQKKAPIRTQAAAGPSGLNVKQSSSVVLPPKATNLEKPGVQLKRVLQSPIVTQQKDQNVQRVQQQVAPAKKTINPAAMKIISLSASQIQNLKLNMERSTMVNRVIDPVKITPNRMVPVTGTTPTQVAGSRGLQRPPIILSNNRNNQMKLETAASSVTISKIPNQSPTRTIVASQRGADNSAGPATVTRIIAPNKRVNEVI